MEFVSSAVAEVDVHIAVSGYPKETCSLDALSELVITVFDRRTAISGYPH